MALLPDPIRIDLYLTRENLQQIPLAQGTFGSLSIEARILASDGEPINLSGYGIRYAVRREIGENIGYYAGSVSTTDNTIAVLPITEWITSEPGTLFFFVELVEESERESNSGTITLPFQLIIKRTYASEIVQSNDFKFLTDNMAAIDDAVQDANTALSKVENVAKNEAAREQAEKERENYWKTAKPEIEEATEKATAAAEHPPKIENNYWLEWNFSTGAYVNTGVLAKGPKGDPFEVGKSFDTLAELNAAYPNGDGNISHLVDDDLHVWDGTSWKPIETKIDLTPYQTINDGTLKTRDKTVPGAINELLEDIRVVQKTVTNSGLLINSNFSVWQRATSYAVTTTANYGGPDRWKFKQVSGTPVISQLTATSGLKCTGGSCTMLYLMNAYDLANVQGKVCALSYKLNGSVKTSQITPTSQTVLSLTLSNGDQLEWVKLELGTQATDYKQPNYTQNLLECMRYFQILPSVRLGTTIGTGAFAYFLCDFTIEMENSPTVQYKSSFDNSSLEIAGSSGYTPTQVEVGSVGLNYIALYVYANNLPSNIPIIGRGIVWLDAEL